MKGLIQYTRPAGLFDWNKMLDGIFDGLPEWETRTPSVDIHEGEKAYVMEAELPGLMEKDIELKVEENLLTISSKKEESKEEKKDGYLMRERRSREFKRSFVLPEEVDREKINAEFKNGLLTVTIPKTPKAKARLIDVKIKQ